jgi:signal transduction histidine kinase
LLSLPLLFQILFIAVMIKMFGDSVAAEKWATHSKEVLALADRVLANAVEAQSDARGAVIVGTDTFRVKFEAASKGARAGLAELDEKVADNPSQQAKVGKVRERFDALEAWLTDQVGAALGGRMTEAQEHVRSLQGARLVQEVRSEMEEFVSREAELDRSRGEEVRATRLEQQWALGAGAALAMGVTALAVYLFGKGIAGRLAVATENASLLAMYQPLRAPVSGTDEIAVLDAAMHQASARLREAAEQEARYQRELRERADELARTNESLRQQTQENEMFVYSVSHDLRSPLVNLQGFAKELSLTEVELREIARDPRLPADVRQQIDSVLQRDVGPSLRFIQTAVSRSAAIIDALLRLSRAGRVVYRSAEVDVGMVAQRVADAMRSTTDARGATVVIRRLSPALGDPTAIEQVFGNLMGNAVNYLDPKRRGEVEVGMAEPSSRDVRGRVTYYVRDNGMGIPAEYLGKVFVAFQRLHGEGTRGEGIGLALVRRIVERHGGRVWVESTVGVGSTFFVELPSAVGPEEPVTAESPRGQSVVSEVNL